MSAPLFIVDAFTSERFRGNPAAVCLLDTPAQADWMQSVAAEMNLSETAFVVPQGEQFGLRWFTPRVEVDLCGHATLAAAHVLWSTGRLSPTLVAAFVTRSGVLRARRQEIGIELDFPARPGADALLPPGIAEALGCEAVSVSRGSDDYLVEVPDEATVRCVAPDFARLATLPARGVIVTARAADPRFDFVSRFFAPAVGVDEDPVTGSAHCMLAVHWGRKLARRELRAFQASSRGGTLDLRWEDDRVFLAGQAVTVVQGELV